MGNCCSCSRYTLKVDVAVKVRDHASCMWIEVLVDESVRNRRQADKRTDADATSGMWLGMCCATIGEFCFALPLLSLSPIRTYCGMMAYLHCSLPF